MLKTNILSSHQNLLYNSTGKWFLTSSIISSLPSFLLHKFDVNITIECLTSTTCQPNKEICPSSNISKKKGCKIGFAFSISSNIKTKGFLASLLVI